MDSESEDLLDHRRDELRRIVYGTPGEPPARVVAELVALEHELQLAGRDDDAPGPSSRSPAPSAEAGAHRRERARARAPEPVPEPGPGPEPGPTREPEAPALRAPTRRWRIPTSLIALAVTAGAIALLGPAREVLSPPRGLEVFERSASAEELARAGEVSVAAHLDAAASSSLRAIGHAVGYEVWVYRDAGSVCLLTQRDFWFAWVSSCVSLDEFRERGLVRRIPAGEISDLTRPNPVSPDDVVLVEWGPWSAGVEWHDVPGGEPRP
jgi:hypothetical protein